MTGVTTARTTAAQDPASAWRERSGQLYEELRRPARAMIRRAFRGAFSDDEIEDVYSNAWVGTLRALEHRHAQLDDEEIRKYVLTAVAHHASKELRRRKRRPTAPLDGVHAVADDGPSPAEAATKLEESRVARDLLASLPPRRRAVMLLRYGWGLEPSQVCRLVQGLSPRAYRKEITRGVDELTEKLRLVQSGEWCSDREPVLKAYAAGLADADQRRQAQQHLSHCRHCHDFVGRLSGQLHDIGGAVAIPAAAQAIHGNQLSLADRFTDVVHRAKETAAGAFGRAPGDASQEATSQGISIAAGARGAGTAGTGILAKLAGIGAAGKLAAACLGGGAAATACLAAGVLPVHLPSVGGSDSRPTPQLSGGYEAVVKSGTAHQIRLGAPSEPVAVGDPAPAPDPEPPPTTTTTTPPVTTTTSTSSVPIAPTTPPPQQEFGVESAASTASTSSSTPSTTGSGGSLSGGGGGSSPAVAQEFGP
jgi:RNA polymerase sigma factor (sigma-70 family)